MKQWHVVTDDPYDTCRSAVTFEAEVDSFSVEAMTKWDGCTHLWLSDCRTPDDEAAYIHICDLDEFIAALQVMRAQALAYFGGEFCVGLLREDEVQPKIDALKQQEMEFTEHPSGLLVPKESQP